ncbi:MAG: hypothetical protein DWQ04_18015 [Chloroflexi bacterium]|nr:MAG: hypothetical protein DWQ04_18015 [Chloroflexota bacterium]
MNRVQLRDDIVINFNEAELRALCQRLDLDSDALSGKTHRDRISVLIGKLERDNRLAELVRVMVEKRPYLAQRYADDLADTPASPTEEDRLNWLDNMDRPIEEPPTMRWDTTARHSKDKSIDKDNQSELD